MTVPFLSFLFEQQEQGIPAAQALLRRNWVIVVMTGAGNIFPAIIAESGGGSTVNISGTGEALG